MAKTRIRHSYKKLYEDYILIVHNLNAVLNTERNKAKQDRIRLKKIVKVFNTNWPLIDDDEDMPLPLADIIFELKVTKIYMEQKGEEKERS